MLGNVDNKFSKNIDRTRLLFILKFIKLYLPGSRLFVATIMSFVNDGDRDVGVRLSDDTAFIVGEFVSESTVRAIVDVLTVVSVFNPVDNVTWLLEDFEISVSVS